MVEELKGQELQELVETINDLLRRFNSGEEMIRHGAAVPTYEPRTFFEQFFLYENAGTFRLYIFLNNTWRLIALT